MYRLLEPKNKWPPINTLIVKFGLQRLQMHEHDLYIIIISHGPKTLCVIKVTLLFHYVIKKPFLQNRISKWRPAKNKNRTTNY